MKKKYHEFGLCLPNKVSLFKLFFFSFLFLSAQNVCLVEFAVIIGRIVLKFRDMIKIDKMVCNLGNRVSKLNMFDIGVPKIAQILYGLFLSNHWMDCSETVMWMLSSLSFRDFLPRGSGIVTRRPLVLQLINSNTGEWKSRSIE